MRIRPRKDTEIKEGDLTPMIDMTFQLIAFFMLLINFSEIEKSEEIELPGSVLAKKPDQPPDYRITLNLEADGTINLAGTIIDENTSIKPYLDREINQAGRQDVKPEEIDVIIRADKLTETGVVQDLIAKCQQVDLANFRLRVNDLGRGRIPVKQVP